MRPFPQGIVDVEERKSKWMKYREDIIEENGVAIFMMGNKMVDGKKTIADGCLQEYQIAKKNNCILIPIGSTGDAAKVIYNEMKGNKEDYPYLEKYFDILGTETDIDKLVEIVVEIVKTKRVV